MKIKGRIYFFLILLMILLIGITLISFVLLERIIGMADDIYQIRLQSIDLLIEADRDAYQSNLALTTLLWMKETRTASLEKQKVLLDDIQSNMDQVLDRYSQFAALLEGESSDTVKTIESFYPLESSWRTLTKELLTFIQQEETDSAVDLYQKEYDEKFQSMRDLMDQLTGYSLERAESSDMRIKEFGRFLALFYIIFIVAGFILGAFTLIVVITKILRPIYRVNHRVYDLSSGEGDLTQRLPQGGEDEMSELAGNINLFIEKTEHILIELKDAFAESDQVKAGIVGSIQENSAASTQIAANINSISSQVESMDKEIHVVSQSTSHVEDSIQVFEDQVVNQVTMVEESTASITEMIASIANLSKIALSRKESTHALSRTIDEGDVRVQESAVSVEAIHQDIDSILEMTKIIAGIASQTNLLAMNAAIEAAHAGEAGKGFAVVADEIRKLAETSSKQSKSINSVLSKIIENIEKAQDASLFSSQTYKEILKEFKVLSMAFEEISTNSSELDEGGKQILDAMHNLQDQSLTIKEEAGSLKESNKGISLTMENLTNISLQVDNAVKEINQGIGDIAASMEDMGLLSKTLNEAMTRAEKYVGRFRLSHRA